MVGAVIFHNHLTDRQGVPMPLSARALAQSRSQFYRLIRDFFDQQAFVETETPILSTHLIPERAIEVFKTELNHPHRNSDTLFLCPSPELYMKLLVSEGIGDCYQICKVFRNAEHYSNRHFAEFTMLEWYAMGRTYIDNIALTQQLLTMLASHAHSETAYLFKSYVEVSVAELFQQKVDINLDVCNSLEAFQDLAHRAGFSDYAARAKSWEELFNLIFISHVENELPSDQTLFLKDYPSQIPTTAKRNGNNYERWEVYMKGWEIANCYTEESKYEQMLALFKQEEKQKRLMKTSHCIDYGYLDIFKKPFPECSGVAMGLDRLFAIFMNRNRLDDVTLFPFSDQLK